MSKELEKELEALERLYNGVVFYYGEYHYERNIIDDELRRKNLESVDKDYALLKQALKRNTPKRKKQP